MDNEETHSADFHALEKRMVLFDAKIDKVDTKIDASSERTKAAIELLTARIDERSKTQELRWDMDHRQTEQAIALLSATAAEARQAQASTEARVVALEESRAVTLANLAASQRDAEIAHKALSDRADNVKRLGWAVVTAVLAIAAYLIDNGLTNHVHP